MRRGIGIAGGLAALLFMFGVSNLQRSPESRESAEPAKPTVGHGRNEQPADAYEPCKELAERLRRFVNAPIPASAWPLPRSCYEPSILLTDQSVQAFVGVDFVLATVPNPISTHLSLFFDRMIQAIQQAAQDNGYSYDASWFPWQELPDYVLLEDHQKAEELNKIQQSQPGVMVFRRALPGTPAVDPYENGLVVFLVGEQPTGGISDDQFENALAWMESLRPYETARPLEVLGPTFTGSAPSLQRALDRFLADHSETPIGVHLSSGTVSSASVKDLFDQWATGKPDTWFRTTMESDALITDRFCDYLRSQNYQIDRVAFLSEDETAFGGSNSDISPCAEAIRLYYPRDVATLRSAYQRQSVFSAARGQPANTPSTTLRGDLSEPANSDHDTVHSYGQQLTSLDQESTLLDIVNKLKEKQIQFIILRSTNSLDQLFLSEFLRRAYPGGRVVIDGSDLLFARGAEGRALRGVMVLSTYPLLQAEQDWTPSLIHRRNGSYRTFGADVSEGEYIAARNVFPQSEKLVPLHDYVLPDWAEDRDVSCERKWRPPAWISVIANRQFWPVAALSRIPSESKAQSILDNLPYRDSVYLDADPTPLSLPAETWVVLVGFMLASCFHGWLCAKPSMFGSLRARGSFEPVPLAQQPVLIALGTVLIAMAGFVSAVLSGLFAGFSSTSARLCSGTTLALSVIVAVWGGGRNFRLEAYCEKRNSAAPGVLRRWRIRAAVGGAVLFAVYAGFRSSLLWTLKPDNKFPAFLRSVHLFSGVSSLLPQLLLIAGAYLWFWYSLRGTALFGDDRPRLPDLPDLPMFDRGCAGQPVEAAGRPLGRGYLRIFLVVFAVTTLVFCLALADGFVRTLGERSFGILIFLWIDLFAAVILTDAIQLWRTWSELRKLLVSLDRLPLRRTLSALQGLAWGSIWKMGGNVLEERYRVITFQNESLRHLTNAINDLLFPYPLSVQDIEAVKAELASCAQRRDEFVHAYVALQGTPELEPQMSGWLVTSLCDFQSGLSSLAAIVLKSILIPEWKKEIDSLIFRQDDERKKDAPDILTRTRHLPRHVKTAEEFFALVYLAFIQNALGRTRSIALGSLWLFVATTLAVSSYPFDPLNVLAGIFLGVFLVYALLAIVVYSQMSRDATLSHITNTRPGELGWEFWERIISFGVGPVIGLLTTLFPSITDFVFSWLQPGMQQLK